MRAWRLHLALFVVTVLTTLGAGAYYFQDYDLFADFPRRVLPGLAKGVPFSLPLIAILGSHELAHYISSKRHGVDATLPYFLPFPNIFGTLGAVIKIKSPILNRRALVDIGASGPLTGFVLAVAAMAVGLTLSGAAPQAVPTHGQVEFGPSILVVVMVKLILGAGAADQAVSLHPIAVAGWVGLFVTSINLMPVGQLDGGHIAYAFLGNRHRLVSRVFIVLLAAMGLLFPGWLIWAALLLLIGTRHPPVADPHSRLDLTRKLLGAASLVVFVITFPPMPVFINF